MDVLRTYSRTPLYMISKFHASVIRVLVVSAALAKLAAGGYDKVDLVLNRRTFPIPTWIYKRL